MDDFDFMDYKVLPSDKKLECPKCGSRDVFTLSSSHGPYGSAPYVAGSCKACYMRSEPFTRVSKLQALWASKR